MNLNRASNRTPGNFLKSLSFVLFALFVVIHFIFSNNDNQWF
jgi:preprotein translocase subunit SecG